MTYFFTADEHYGHKNIIKYCNRPFENVTQMNQQLIKRHNEVVKPTDIVIHAGDFTLSKDASQYIEQLVGINVFLRGSHDYWLKDGPFLWEKTINGQHVVVSHYPMLSWPKSYYGSWQLYGHVHGKGQHYKNQVDIGVDCWGFYPVRLSQVKGIIDLFDVLSEESTL